MFLIGNINIHPKSLEFINLGLKFIPSFNRFDLYFFLSNFYNSLSKLNKFSFFESNNQKNKVSKDNLEKSFRQSSDSLLKFLKKEFPKKSTNLNFILKSTNNFRNLFLDNFFEFFSKNNDFSDSFNLNLLKSTIYNLKKNQIIVTSADKNICTTLIESKIYHTLCYDHLNNANIYSKIDNNPLDLLYERFLSQFDYLHNNGHISSHLYRVMIDYISKNKKLANFRILPKLHKNKLGIRPLVNCSNSISSGISKILDFFFKPLVSNHYSYIKDSQDLLLKTKDLKFDKNIKLFSADFESLYTNIPLDECIEIITLIISEHSCFHISIVGFNSLLKLLLKNSYFFYKCNDKILYFLQIKGIFMGTAVGPSLANLYLSYYENLNSNLKSLPLFYRFIDDLFYVNYDNNEISTSDFKTIYPHLNLNIFSDSSVIFLDLEISCNSNGYLKYNLYIKPTNTFSYLLPISNHPKHIVKNIPKNLLIRIKRICSTYNDYLTNSNFLMNNLLKRNYPFQKIKNLIFSIGKSDRNKLLPYKSKKTLDMNNKIFYISNYEKSFCNSSSFIHRIWNNSIISDNFLKNTSLNIVYKLNFNLGSYFMYNFNSFYKSNQYIKCSNSSCKTCFFANTNSSLSNNFNIRLNIHSNSSCHSSNCIYFISCLKFNVFYIGQTKRNIYIRIREHLSLINSAIKLKNIDINGFNNRFIDCSHFQSRYIYKHFASDHILERDFKFQIFASDIFDHRIRLENDLIRLFNTKFPNGLNDKVSNYIKSLDSYVI